MFDTPFAMVHYKFQVGTSTPIAFMDLWRFNGTCIEEHMGCDSDFAGECNESTCSFLVATEGGRVGRRFALLGICKLIEISQWWLWEM